MELNIIKSQDDKNLNHEIACDNLELAQKQYGIESIFCLQSYLTLVSSFIRQIDTDSEKTMSNSAENVLSRMMKVLEARKEIENGNQYFFVASNMIGLLLQSMGENDRAHLFFNGTLRKQLKYVGEEDDLPFLELTYSHLALLMKAIRNMQGSLVYWELLAKTHTRAYGDMTSFLTADYKNIGNCQLSLNEADKAIESFQKGVEYSQNAIDHMELSEKEMKAEQEELSSLYFSIYLSFNAQEKLEEAFEYNQKSLDINLVIKGESDLNVANNYHLAAQIRLK